MHIKGRNFGPRSLRNRIERTFGSVLFAATALFYLGGTIAMFLQAPTLAA